MPVHTTAVRYGRDRAEFVVRRHPWWSYLVYTLVERAFGVLCSLSRHRFCNARLYMWAIRFRDRHQDEFVLPSTKAQLHDYERWRGWRDWDTDPNDEDDEDDADTTTTG